MKSVFFHSLLLFLVFHSDVVCDDEGKEGEVETTAIEMMMRVESLLLSFSELVSLGFSFLWY